MMQRGCGQCMSPSNLIICTHLDRMGDLSMVRNDSEVYSRRTKEGSSAVQEIPHM